MRKKYPYRCRDGDRVQSLRERIIDDWLSSKGVKHKLYPKLPGTNFKADWKVGDTYIEYWGMMNIESYVKEMKLKLEYYKKSGLRLIQIKKNDNITIKLYPLLSIAPRINLEQILKHYEEISKRPEIQAIDASIDKREAQINILEEEKEELSIKRNQIINKLLNEILKILKREK